MDGNKRLLPQELIERGKRTVTPHVNQQPQHSVLCFESRRFWQLVARKKSVVMEERFEEDDFNGREVVEPSPEVEIISLF